MSPCHGLPMQEFAIWHQMAPATFLLGSKMIVWLLVRQHVATLNKNTICTWQMPPCLPLVRLPLKLNGK